MTFERALHVTTLTALLLVLGALLWIVQKDLEDAKTVDPNPPCHLVKP